MARSEGGWGWVVVFSSFYHHAGVGGAIYSLSIFYSSWVEDFDSGRGLTSWVLTFAMAVSMGSGPIVATLVSRFGHRPVVVAGSILCAAGAFLSCFATSVYVLILLIGFLGAPKKLHNICGDRGRDGAGGLYFSGMGQGMQYLPSIAIIPLYFHKRRSLAVGLAVSGVGVGTFCYPPFLTWLEEHYTWRGAMIVLSGFILNMAVCGFLLRPVDPASVEGNRQDDETKPLTAVSAPLDTSGISAADPPSAELETEKSSNKRLVEKCDRTNTERIDYVFEESSVELKQKEKQRFLQAEPPLISGSLTHLKKQNADDGHAFSSAMELRHKPHVHKSEGHFTTSSYRLADRVHHRPLAKSHVDFLLSSSICDLAKADQKRHRSENPLKISTSKGMAFSNVKESTEFPKENGNHIGSISHSDLPNDYFTTVSKDSEDVEAHSIYKEHSRSSRRLCCPTLPSAMTLYLDLLRNPYFVAFAFANFLACFTYLMPIVYLVDRALDNGVEKTQAALAFSMYGAGNLFGRVALGWLADNVFDSLILDAICLIVCGISTCLSALCGASAVLHGLYGFIYGTFIGGFVTVTPVILVELLGLDLVSHSYGLILTFQAVGFIVGTPMAGWIFDATHSYTASFIIHGVVITVSGLVLVAIKLVLIRSSTKQHCDTLDWEYPEKSVNHTSNGGSKHDHNV
ncbi:monocarboxylate transporter [Plakobranchus ocellatus]|uniref:Monocarboxylate transporter n=1 Tax=Plakobranchus ocellatus TaxID=259542 RepID=A0AAV4DS81_9GAST|nr:monocarboxylate transporter [Plakobranchus ocellatus]